MVNRSFRKDWTISNGESAEKLAGIHDISRDAQDEFALRSHRLAADAWAAGVYDDEIVQVPGAELARDEGIRDDTSIELSKVYVLETSHGSGAAGTLMTATLEAAAATGAPSCWLGVNQLNARAARFYEKSGFAIAGTKRFRVGADWHDDHIRTRVLQ